MLPFRYCVAGQCLMHTRFGTSSTILGCRVEKYSSTAEKRFHEQSCLQLCSQCNAFVDGVLDSLKPEDCVDHNSDKICRHLPLKLIKVLRKLISVALYNGRVPNVDLMYNPLVAVTSDE